MQQICPICRSPITMIKSHWGEIFGLCNCGIRPEKEIKRYMKAAANPFEKWEI